MKHLIVLLGPTGVGKTELALTLAEKYNTPIINADSRQIFAELPIGTAAPTQEQQKKVKHYFVGSHHIHDYYSASMYEQDVISLLSSLFQSKNIAILTGGSMMYIDAVCNGIDDIPTIDDLTRATLKTRLQEEGLAVLLEELHQLDPEYWSVVDHQNPRRIVHALEICLMTGKTYTSFRTNEKKKRPFNIIKIGLNRDREELYQRINSRVLDMASSGLEEEARRVYEFRQLNSLNTVGYKEMFAYIQGEISYEEAIRQIQSNTRRYMRKQMTWFKKDPDIQWFTPNMIPEILNYIDKQIV